MRAVLPARGVRGYAPRQFRGAGCQDYAHRYGSCFHEDHVVGVREVFSEVADEVVHCIVEVFPGEFRDKHRSEQKNDRRFYDARKHFAERRDEEARPEKPPVHAVAKVEAYQVGGPARAASCRDPRQLPVAYAEEHREADGGYHCRYRLDYLRFHFLHLHHEYYEREAHRDEYGAQQSLGQIEQSADRVAVYHVAQRVRQLPPWDHEHYVAYHDFVRVAAYPGFYEKHDRERRRGAAKHRRYYVVEFERGASVERGEEYRAGERGGRAVSAFYAFNLFIKLFQYAVT